MSESIKNNGKRVEELLAFTLGMMNGENGLQLIEKYKEAIDHITPNDMLKLEDKQIQMGITPKNIKKHIGKIINIFFNSLAKYSWNKPVENTFLYYLMLENEALKFRLGKITQILKNYNKQEVKDFKKLQEDLLTHFADFNQFESHYAKKENILFPFLEKKWESYRPIMVMWSLHDDIRKKLKLIIQLLKSDTSIWDDLNKEIGSYFFLVNGMIQKEEKIIFPEASETISDDEWKEMYLQSFEYPFPFIEIPKKPEIKIESKIEKQNSISQIDGDLMWKSETGELNFEQILLLLNNLPIDITFVDENDKVKFFSKPEERFFPRSPAIIGRDVKNCHPPESVHIVEKIVNSFKNGEKDTEQFWLKMKGKFILIQYFALRNSKGEYKGVLEASQEVSEIRALEGEKRLLD